MTRYYLLIYRKGARKPMGVIPTKKGITKDAIRKRARKQISKSFNYRVITESDLKKLYKSLMKK